MRAEAGARLRRRRQSGVAQRLAGHPQPALPRARRGRGVHRLRQRRLPRRRRAVARGERFAPSGLSITAPFKEDALTFAARVEAMIAPNAAEARAVNTLVRTPRGVVADNTDVDGFQALIARTTSRRAAVLGAGATARAALRRAAPGRHRGDRLQPDGGKLDALPLGDFRRPATTSW